MYLPSWLYKCWTKDQLNHTNKMPPVLLLIQLSSSIIYSFLFGFWILMWQQLLN